MICVAYVRRTRHDERSFSGQPEPNGWAFWQYEHAPGDWVLLDEMENNVGLSVGSSPVVSRFILRAGGPGEAKVSVQVLKQNKGDTEHGQSDKTWFLDSNLSS